MKRTIFRIGLSATMFAFGLGLAHAEAPKGAAAPPAKTEAARPVVDAEPNSTSASFGDWVMRCQRVGAGAAVQRVCEVALQIRAQDQQEVAEIAIGRLTKTDPLHLTVVLPVNVTLTNPPGFFAAEGQSEGLELAWRKCMTIGCFADASLKDEMLRRWSTLTSPGRIVWKDGSGRELAVATSFRGLSQALDALSKEPMS